MFFARHKRGYGVHSPFAFDLITNVIEERHPYYVFQKIESLRKKLVKDRKELFVTDFGTGESGKRKVAHIATKSLSKKRYAQLLFRLVRTFKPNTIIELGTSLGITTAYLASVDSKATVYSFEGCPQIAQIAQQVLSSCALQNVNIIVGNIDITLAKHLANLDSLDFVLFDANHTKEATLRYFNLCLSRVHEKTVFVFDDIHYSREMEDAWTVILSHSQVTVTFDLFTLGIVFFDMKLTKHNYRLLF